MDKRYMEIDAKNSFFPIGQILGRKSGGFG
jgi:hypothetical protein